MTSAVERRVKQLEEAAELGVLVEINALGIRAATVIEQGVGKGEVEAARMAGIERGGFEVLAVAVEVVLQHRVDAERPINGPVDIFGQIEADAHRERAAQIVGLAVVQAAGLRLGE